MQAIDNIRVAASMHDIGKIGVPNDLLQHSDTLTHPRPSRPAFPEEEALDMMGEGRGKQLDPVIFDVFIESLPVFRRITERVANEAA